MSAESEIDTHAATINMPTILDGATIAETQLTDPELPALLTNSALTLTLLEMENNPIYCNIDNNVVESYLPPSLRKTAFEVLHNLAHLSIRATVRLLSQKFV